LRNLFSSKLLWQGVFLCSLSKGSFSLHLTIILAHVFFSPEGRAGKKANSFFPFKAEGL